MWPEGPQQHTLVGAGVRIMSRAQPFLGALAAHAPPNASNTQTRPGLAGVCAWLAALSPEAPACLRAGRRKASFFSNLRVFIVCCCGWFVERHTIQSSSKTHPHPLQESALEGPRKLCRGQEVQPCLLGTTGCRDRRCLSLSVCLSLWGRQVPGLLCISASLSHRPPLSASVHGASQAKSPREAFRVSEFIVGTI